jgi:predicted nucleic acid binding AN1-type Zn finger protein
MCSKHFSNTRWMQLSARDPLCLRVRMNSWSATITRKCMIFYSKMSAPESRDGIARQLAMDNTVATVTSVDVGTEIKFVSYPASLASAKPGSFRTDWYDDCSEASQPSFKSPNARRVRRTFAKPFITSWMTTAFAKWTQLCSRVFAPTQKSGSSMIKRPLVLHATSDTSSGWSSSRLHLAKKTSNISRRTIVEGSFSCLCGPGRRLSRACE